MEIPYKIGDKVYVVDTFFREPTVKELEVTDICLELGAGLARYIYSATKEGSVFKNKENAEIVAKRIEMENSKKPYWEIFDGWGMKCSICGFEYNGNAENANYCSNCGACMIQKD